MTPVSDISLNSGLSAPPRWRSCIAEISSFNGNDGAQFLARTRSNRFYVIGAPLVVLLNLLDGSRSLVEVAAALSVSRQQEVTPQDVENVISKELAPRGLVRNSSMTHMPGGVKPPKSRKIDFIFRVPLLTAAQIAPLTDRLSFLYEKHAALLMVLLIGLAHFFFYAAPAPSRAWSSEPPDLALAYVVCFLSVAFHELGHAAACRRFRCEHEEIGFCLYLVFPAMYVNLSRAWQLPREQRAVIDVGGIYFQQLLFLLLVGAQFAFHLSFLPLVLYSIDAMSVFSLNPFLKFDGYWLLADVSGIANLQKRAFDLMRATSASVFGRRPRTSFFPGLRTSQARILCVYTSALLLLMTYFFPRMALALPRRIAQVLTEGELTFAAMRQDASTVFVHLKAFLFAALVIPLLVRLALLAKQPICALWKRII